MTEAKSFYISMEDLQEFMEDRSMKYNLISSRLVALGYKIIFEKYIPRKKDEPKCS